MQSACLKSAITGNAQAYSITSSARLNSVWQDLAAELFCRLAVRSRISGYSMSALPPRKRADRAPIKSLPQQ